MTSQCMAQQRLFHESVLPGPAHPANSGMTPLTLFVWLLLAVCRLPCSAYRAEGGLEHALQACKNCTPFSMAFTDWLDSCHICFSEGFQKNYGNSPWPDSGGSSFCDLAVNSAQATMKSLSLFMFILQSMSLVRGF
jgi:hypothetical protein